MGLLDLQTDLKSFKFGVPPSSDRPGGGNSGQPYIKKSIERGIVPQSEDFLLRGGINAPLDAATDVARLGKFFSDLKSPRGALFVAKQNLLSRTGVATQASDIINWKEAPLNEGVYTPLSTLAQAGVGFTGAHLPKQGAVPFKGVRTYMDAKFQIIGTPSGEGNRLVDLYTTQIPNQENNFTIANPVTLYSYSGGPNSDLGIGKTNIKFATDNKGAPLLSGIATKDYQSGLKYNRFSLTSPPTGISNKWFDFTKLLDSVSFPDISTDGGLTYQLSSQISVYDKGTLNSSDSSKILGIGAFNNKSFTTLTQEQIEDIATVRGEAQFFDFRKLPLQQVLSLSEDDPNKSSTIMGLAPSYYMGNGKTIEGRAGSRIRQSSPGQKGNVLNYTKGKIVNGKVSVVDHINFQPLYKSKNVRTDNEVDKNDLIKFRIGAILRDSKKVFMHFRAFINSFSDAYSSDWNGIKYMGRGEQFYKYGGFSRKISLSYTVAAQSKPELMAQYKKLNFLASTLAPDYGDSGYMGGVLTTLTMGGWCFELPGFINNLSLEVPQESPWEIAIPATKNFADTGNPIYSDKTVKEMPHICNVSMEFTPIHTFRPELQDNGYGGDNSEVSRYGEQRFLKLTNGYNNNYVPVSLNQAQQPIITEKDMDRQSDSGLT
jgi:hypothetical protein